MHFRQSSSGFTLIELIIGMTIFSIGITGIYALLSNTMSSVGYSRDEIIVSWLLREEIDLVMNIRDTNLRNFIPWDSIHIDSPSSDTTFSSGIYMIENELNSSNNSIDPTNGRIHSNTVKLVKLDPFPNDINLRWQKTQLRLDDKWRYIHSETSGTPTQFASYIIISPLTINGIEVKKNSKNQWWVIDARVIIKGKWPYREYDAKSMITDWMK